MATPRKKIANALIRLAKTVQNDELERLKTAYDKEKKEIEAALKSTESLLKGKIISAWFSLSVGNPDTGSEWRVFCQLGAHATAFSKECQSIREMENAAAAFKNQIKYFTMEMGLAETAFSTLQDHAKKLNDLIPKIRRLEKKAK